MTVTVIGSVNRDDGDADPTSRVATNDFGDEARGFDAVTRVDKLPRPTQQVRHGYAVSLSGPMMGSTGWLFFHALEPALVFGRAGRMGPATGYGVRSAAIRTRFQAKTGLDYREIFLGESLDRRDGEVEVFTRWVEGVRQCPMSSHWHPPVQPTSPGG